MLQSKSFSLMLKEIRILSASAEKMSVDILWKNKIR